MSKTLVPAEFSLASLAAHCVTPMASTWTKVNSDTHSALLEAIVRSTDDAIITKNLSSLITSWNPAATAIFGWEAHEMIGHSVLRLIPQRLYFEELEIINRLKAGERIQHYETFRVRRDGSEIQVSLTISPLRNARGEVIGATKIARNVTEQRAAERARLQLAAIVESSEDAILARDAEDIVTSWNAGAEQMFGYTAAQAIGMSAADLVPPERRDEAGEMFAKLLAGQRVAPFESVRQHRDGRCIPVSISVSAIRGGTGVDANEIVGESQIIRDMSRHKELEQSLLCAEKLAATTELATEVAHYVNNPLEALMNLLFLARVELANPEFARGLLEQAEDELLRVALFTRRALDENRKSAEEARTTVTGLSEALHGHALLQG